MHLHSPGTLTLIDRRSLDSQPAFAALQSRGSGDAAAGPGVNGHGARSMDGDSGYEDVAIEGVDVWVTSEFVPSPSPIQRFTHVPKQQQTLHPLRSRNLFRHQDTLPDHLPARHQHRQTLPPDLPLGLEHHRRRRPRDSASVHRPCACSSTLYRISIVDGDEWQQCRNTIRRQRFST